MDVYNIQNLSFSIKKKLIIDNISFLIKSPSIVGLLGPNGAGKSTLINLLTGVQTRYGGNIRFLNRNIRGNEIETKCEIAAILDHSSTYDTITVRENICYYIKLLNVKPKIGEDLLVEFELDSYKNHKVSELSSGYKQRLKIVISLLRSPTVIFLDEPWLALDPINASFLSKKINEICSVRKITFVVSGHDLSELDELCNHLIFLKEGRIVLDFYRKQGSEFTVHHVKKTTSLDDRFKKRFFIDTNKDLGLIINARTEELDGMELICTEIYSLKELYFNLLTN